MVSGHFCWCCDRRRPNEKFSGRGHARHICKRCQKLPKTERAYRQGVRNIDRCLTFDGVVRRKRRKQFESFLTHPNPRIRAYAEELERNNIEQRLESTACRWYEEATYDAWYAWEAVHDAAEDQGAVAGE